jgi:DNA-binding CsgD family transcriptional regulator
MTSEFSDLIGRIYDTALDLTLWPEVLADTARFLPGHSAALYVKDAASKSGGLHYDDGVIDAHYKQMYFDAYIKFDPVNCGHFFADVEVPMATADIVPYDEFVETRFYREWAQPQGLVDCLNVVIDESLTSSAIFGIFRNEQQGVIDDTARQRMRLIVPHIKRAVLIGRAIDYKTAQADTLAEALDSLSSSIFLVGEGGRLVQANAAGHVMLAEGAILRAKGGRLNAIDAAADKVLRDAFKRAEDGDAGLGTRAIAVTLVAADSISYLAHVLPLTSGARRKAGAGYSAVAAVFVRCVQLEGPAMPEVIGKLYDLTPSELRVLLAVYDTAGVSDIAATLGISEATAKTHLGKLFTKTGTKRQADLVKLVAGFAATQRA